jgi:putative Mn2+ efflux pump MntP
MPIWEILGLAVGLGLDAMSVAAAVGVRWHGPRQKFRMAWHAGLFQFLMPIAGWLAGKQLAGLLSSVGAWVAGGLVFIVGAKMLHEALKSHPGAVEERVEEAIERAVEHSPAKADEAPQESAASDPTRGWSLVVLSVATSLDALVVGFSLGIKGAGDIWYASAVIGVVAAAMSLAGVAIGRRVGQAIGRPAEIAGAAVLMALGVSFPLW